MFWYAHIMEQRFCINMNTFIEVKLNNFFRFRSSIKKARNSIVCLIVKIDQRAYNK